MARTSAIGRADLVANPRASLLLWRLPAAAMLATFLVGDTKLTTAAWTAALTQMGLACLVNASGCGRLHCFFTGPFFLLGAVASLLQGLGVVRLGWGKLGIGLLAGGLALGYGPELLWGKYARQSTSCGPNGPDAGAGAPVARLPVAGPGSV